MFRVIGMAIVISHRLLALKGFWIVSLDTGLSPSGRLASKQPPEVVLSFSLPPSPPFFSSPLLLHVKEKPREQRWVELSSNHQGLSGGFVQRKGQRFLLPWHYPKP